MSTTKVLALCAILEALTGVALLINPMLVASLLLADGGPAEAATGRLAGLGLFSLGVACWPGFDGARGLAAAQRAMSIYNPLVAIYFLQLGIRSASVDRKLWAVVGLHGVLTALLAIAWFKEKEPAGRPR